MISVISRLHLITPDARDPSVLDRTCVALAAGATWVQVRSKSGTDRDRLDFARHVTLIAEAEYATCIIDDRVDLAVAVNAAGVHVGSDDLPVEVARTILGPNAIIGATCRNPDDARRAVEAGASYVGVGPVYPTRTKVGLPDPIGLDGLAAVVEALADGSSGIPTVPVIAISGITIDRVGEVLATGAHGIAVVDAVYGAPDVGAATKAFLAAIDAATNRSGPGA